MKGVSHRFISSQTSCAFVFVLLAAVNINPVMAQSNVPKPPESIDEVVKALNQSGTILGDLTRVLLKAEELLSRFMATSNNSVSVGADAKKNSVPGAGRPLGKPAGEDDGQQDTAAANTTSTDTGPADADRKNGTKPKADGKITITITLSASQPIPTSLLKAVLESGANISIPSP